MSSDELQQVRVPLPDFVRDIASEAARVVIREHQEVCPIRDVQVKVDSLRIRFAALVGLLAGSGTLGGVAGGLVSRLL